ncbi:MAG: hypothetical protein F6K40_31080, partial [Okeania sp. SIO3I5]|uniref:hypothetical protein n=1 Tax=Okeania sp. SIO3I5 TaxID=2607805 RepID=UPI0013BC1635
MSLFRLFLFLYISLGLSKPSNINNQKQKHSLKATQPPNINPQKQKYLLHPKILTNKEIKKMKILIVLPYSGAQFTGGLAVVNEELTKELAKNHDVKLLTFELNSKVMATKAGHGDADLLVIKDQHTKSGQKKLTKELGGEGLLNEDERDQLYFLMENDEVLRYAHENLLNDWTPEIILGHSRFSGPAAINLKKDYFTEAKVGYFLHSYPLVEGFLVAGYEIFEEKIDKEKAQEKFDKEKEWIGQADIVLAMGPLMRLAARLILDDVSCNHTRVHEVISGIDKKYDAIPPWQENESCITLLLSGRASAAVKGFQDIVIAALDLRAKRFEQGKKKKVLIKVIGISERRLPGGVEEVDSADDLRVVNADSVQS